MRPTADLVFVNGAVVVVDDAGSVEEALAIRGDRIAAVGDRRSVMELAGDSTRIVDMAGGCLLPGINDSHLHAVSWGLTRPPFSLDVGHPTVSSIADIVAVVKKAADEATPGEWIVGAGWDPGFLAECRSRPGLLPTRLDLDEVSPDNPVFLHDFSYHTAWVNSTALARARIDRTTVPPPGSVIERDAAGNPTGILTEGAQHEVADLLPALTQATARDAILSAVKELNTLGITSLTEPGLGPGDSSGGMSEVSLAAYLDLLAEDKLNVRVTALLLPVPMSSSFEDFASSLDSMILPATPNARMFNIVGVKILADGIPPNKTAWMHEHYLGGGAGALTISGDTDQEKVEQLHHMIRHAHRAGYQVGVHVTGDRGIDAVVDGFAAAVADSPRPHPRHYVIHGDFMTPRSLRTCARHGFGVNMNPTIKWTIADLEEEFVGPERAAYEWPYRSTLDAGVVVASGSDAPVTAPNWLQGVSTMVLRESKASGRVSGPEQRITLHEALRTYTAAGAWQDFAESWKGTLEAGKGADLCLLDRNLLSIDPHEIPDAVVQMTVLGGRIVYERDA